jgi:GNAT superfamily N-acetyltransferase
LPEFRRYTAANATHRLGIELLRRFQRASEPRQAEREELFIKDIAKRITRKETVLYLLKDVTHLYGFVALSASSIGEFPSLQIDYLFVDARFRGQALEVLEHERVSTYLLDFSTNLAIELQERIGLRYLVLLPENERLEDFYGEYGFDYLPGHKPWMYLKL